MTDTPVISPFVGYLNMTCVKCTKGGRFPGKTIADSAQAAKDKGWTMPVEGRYNCPRCSRIFGTVEAA